MQPCYYPIAVDISRARASASQRYPASQLLCTGRHREAQSESTRRAAPERTQTGQTAAVEFPVPLPDRSRRRETRRSRLGWAGEPGVAGSRWKAKRRARGWARKGSGGATLEQTARHARRTRRGVPRDGNGPRTFQPKNKAQQNNTPGARVHVTNLTGKAANSAAQKTHRMVQMQMQMPTYIHIDI